MFNYLFILLTLVYVIKTCKGQDYDDVDYYLRDKKGASDDSTEEDEPYQKFENKAKTLLNNVKDKSESPKTKSPRLKQVTLDSSRFSKQIANEKVVDLSNEIETMINEIKSSVVGAKKHKNVTPCPDNVTERITTSNGRKQYKTDKNYDSVETKLARHIHNKNLQREEKSEEAKVVKSPKHRVKIEPINYPVMSDFYEREDYYTTREPKHKPRKHSEQSSSHEQSEELIKTKRIHGKREEHKTKEAKMDQISQPSNENHSETKKPCTTSKDRGNIKPYQNLEKTLKSWKDENFKSAEEKLPTICDNYKKYAQVEPYVDPKESKRRNLRKTKNNIESKEEEKSFEIQTNKFENTEHNRISRSQKNKGLSREEMEKSEEMKSVKPCQHDIQIGRSGRTIERFNEKHLESQKHNHGKSETVEIEVLPSKPYTHKESSEELELKKPCRHVIPEEVKAIGTSNETASAETHKPKKSYDYENVKISETQQDRVEHIGQADDVNTQNGTGSGESKDKALFTEEKVRQAEVTTAEIDKKTKTVVSYPFSVSIQRKGAHFATGALLDKSWILTVAGEFYNVRESIKLYKARLGSVNCKRGGTLVALKSIEIHPQYEPKSPNFDIALIMIAKPMEFNDMIKPIGLSGINTQVISAKFMTTYWSRVIIKGQVLPATANERIKLTSLRVSTQKLIPWDICETLMEMGNATLNPSTLCLRPIESHHSLCTPDAGAPVVAEDGLWGITSGWTSRYCPSNPSPTLFTRVSEPDVRNWIDSNLYRKLTV